MGRPRVRPRVRACERASERAAAHLGAARDVQHTQPHQVLAQRRQRAAAPPHVHVGQGLPQHRRLLLEDVDDGRGLSGAPLPPARHHLARQDLRERRALVRSLVQPVRDGRAAPHSEVPVGCIGCIGCIGAVEASDLEARLD
eukprot:6333000-Prymnesium_polylepis.1